MDNNQANTAPGAPAMEIPPEIKNFLETLLSDSGMTNLEAEMQEEMVKELYARLDNYITSTIVKNMPPENLDEFIKLNEENRPKEEIEAYIKEKLPNAGEVFARAFSEFRDLYLGNVTVARNAPEVPAAEQPAAPVAPEQPIEQPAQPPVPAAPPEAVATEQNTPVQEPSAPPVEQAPAPDQTK